MFEPQALSDLLNFSRGCQPTTPGVWVEQVAMRIPTISCFAALIAMFSIASLAWAEGVSAVAQTTGVVREFRRANEKDILAEFVELLEIPNVAADKPNIERNADHIIRMLVSRGVNARRLEVPGGPPAVYGELPGTDAELTVMVYAHYDGQPVDPSSWTSPPWNPVVRDAPIDQQGRPVDIAAVEGPLDPEWRLYARSAGDDKAPVIGLLWALDALEAAGIPRSINLKFFFDGEEEAGSPHLAQIIAENAELLAADLWLFCDGPVHQTGRPLVVFGVRGITGLELTTYGATRQLHSGHYGNWAPNPIMLLVHLLDSMRDSDGTILVKGFAEAVPEPSSAELRAIEHAPRVDDRLQKEFGLAWTEGGGRHLEETLLRPALNVRGIEAGQVGDDARNAIVDRATASIDIRLVPDLTPDRARILVEEHIEAQGFHIVREEPDMATRREHPRIVKVEWSENGYPAVRTAMDTPIALAITAIVDSVTDQAAVRLPTFGGSLPLHVIDERLVTPIILLPVANHDNNQHAADENLRLGNLWYAIDLYAALIAHLGN